MRKKRFLIFIGLLLLVLLPQQVGFAMQIPKPDSDFYVLDQAKVLSNDAKAHIIYNNDILYKACGAQIVIVTVESAGGFNLADYSRTLANEWKVGGPQQNGVVLVMSIRDDDYYTTQASGIELRLGAGDIAVLQKQYLEPYFAKQQYEKGAIAYFDALFNRVAEAYNVNVQAVDVTGQYQAFLNSQRQTYDTYGSSNYDYDDEDSGFDLGEIIIALIVVIGILYFASRSRRSYYHNSGWGNGGGWGGGTSRPSNGSFWWGYLLGRGSGGGRDDDWNRPRPPRPPSGGGGFGGFGGFGGGGGGGRPTGGFGGGRSGGGGGGFRGSGAGRGR